MDFYLSSCAFLEPIEEWWLKLSRWKRRFVRSSISIVLSLGIFVLPSLFLLDSEHHAAIFTIQSIIGFIVFYFFSVLLTAVAKNRRSLAKLNAELKEISLRDSLTGLYNNRQFMTEQLRYLSTQAKRFDESLVVLFADLDGLKQINDNYSHLAGDLAITSTGVRIQDSIRKNDLVFRFGGDEFLIIASIKQCSTSKEVKNEIENIVKKISLNVSSKPIYYGEDRIPLVISIGAHIINPENTIERELLIVDKKMYQIKENQRNQKQTAV